MVPLPPSRPPQSALDSLAPANNVPLPPRRPPELNEAQAKPAAAPAINSEQINTGESNILDEIGGFLSNLFAGSMGGQEQAPGGYVWDSMQGWVPGQAQAAPAAPKAPAPTPAPAPEAAPQNEPLPGAMGQSPRTVVPSMEFPKEGATPPPAQNMFSKQPTVGPNPSQFER
jgi:hypothetical protein